MKKFFGWTVAIFIVLAIIGGLTNKKDSATTSPTTMYRYESPTYAPTTTANLSWTTTLVADNQAMQTLMEKISTDAANTDVLAVNADCIEGQSSMPRWKLDGALIPDDSVGVPYASAVDHFSAAFDACASGDYATATSELNAGSVDVQTASAAMSGITK